MVEVGSGRRERERERERGRERENKMRYKQSKVNLADISHNTSRKVQRGPDNKIKPGFAQQKLHHRKDVCADYVGNKEEGRETDISRQRVPAGVQEKDALSDPSLGLGRHSHAYRPGDSGTAE